MFGLMVLGATVVAVVEYARHTTEMWKRAAALLGGPELDAMAMMNLPVREAVRRLVLTGAVVRPDEVFLELRGVLSNREVLVSTVNTLVAAAVLLSPRASSQVPAQLAENAASDLNPAVAVRNLTLLIQHHPQRGETHAAIDRALSTRSPELRLLAASHVPLRRALTVLEGLLAAGAASPEVRVRVLDHLAHTKAFPYGKVSEPVRHALVDEHPRVQRAAVTLIAKAHDQSQRNAIADLAGTPDPGLAQAVAAALVTLGGPRAQASLIRLLAHPEVAVRIEAAKGLGVVGTIEVVEPLLKLTEGFLANGVLTEAARASVRRIQSRLGRVEQGRLALAETPSAEGALSLASTGGELAVVTPLESASSLPARTPKKLPNGSG